MRKSLIVFLGIVLMTMSIYSQTKVDLDKFKINNNIPDGEVGIIALNQYKAGLEIVVKSKKANPVKITIVFYDSSYNEKRVDIYVEPNRIAKSMADGINIDNVAEIMKDKTEVVNCDNIDNDYFLNYAENGNLIGVFCSLSNGVNIEEKSIGGNTALTDASRFNQIEIVKYLLSKGANIEAKDSNGDTALAQASTAGYTKIVKYLLSKGANIEAKGYNGFTPLMSASNAGYIETVKYLLSKGANIEAKNNYGSTALIVASETGRVEIVQYLLSKGANRHAKTNKGKTACDLAGTYNKSQKQAIKKLVCN